ncbi:MULTISPECIES: helix-turn-helix transcriptional regulator [Weissella]|uniref:Transcriptional regulator n=1 Tax=Weissella thailandensis TaxID=89061 RepID=A0ABX9I7B3_9LACO|nr:helix-turn-helix transcriptional regulator [Weissella thailandensis]NKY90574.1 helix-turn-helix transcriptional regulator [Weissella thailandensis]RDS60135.1 transcriptional regulator [Weissella thailandensis]GEP73772.1 transcriptional regulator [Weissella thailandensis]
MKNNVKQVRISSSITQKDLAKMVGITRQTLSLIEKGQYNPTLKLAIGIAKSLNVTLDDLFWN